jgi:hypothetical protein
VCRDGINKSNPGARSAALTKPGMNAASLRESKKEQNGRVPFKIKLGKSPIPLLGGVLMKTKSEL